MKNYENYELNTELATVDFTLDDLNLDENDLDILLACWNDENEIDENEIDILGAWAKMLEKNGINENDWESLRAEWDD